VAGSPGQHSDLAGARQSAIWAVSHGAEPESVFIANLPTNAYGPRLGEPAMSHSKSDEIDRNLERFLEVLPALVPDHEGQYALIRHGEIHEFFGSALDAQIAGNQRFDDQLFSIQCVRETAEELGYFSYAVDPRNS
jgi:hypothetical protein